MAVMVTLTIKTAARRPHDHACSYRRRAMTYRPIRRYRRAMFAASKAVISRTYDTLSLGADYQ